jgi:hypothetical protein
MTEASGAVDPASMRASQGDRERASRALNRATDEGRLTSTELAERLDRVTSARTIGDLNAVVSDLPGQDLLAPAVRSDRNPAPAPPFPTPPPFPAVPSFPPAPGVGDGYAVARGYPGGYPGEPTPWEDGPMSPRVGGTPGSTNAIAIMGGATREGNWVVPPKFQAIAVMGGVDLDLTSATFAAPEAVIEAYTLMGGVQVTVPPDITVIVHGGAFMGGFSDSVHQQGPPGAPVLHVTGFALMGGVDVGRRRRPK